MKRDYRIPLYLLPLDLRPDFILNRPRIHDTLHKTICKILAVSGSRGVVSSSTFVFAIMDSSTHQFISGATVSIIDSTTSARGIGVSNPNGVVAITLSSAQSITANVHVSAQGYNDYFSILNLSAGQSTTIDLIPVSGGGGGGNPNASDDMPTYIVSQSAPTLRYRYTSNQVVQRLVQGSGGGNKNYGFFSIDVTAPTSPIPAGYTTISTMSGFNTNNIYWNIQNSSGFRYGTVGVANNTDPLDGNVTVKQFVNPPHGVNVAVGNQAKCVPQSGANPPCFIDSGGEYRNSVYMFVTDPTVTKAYQIVGGSVIKQGDGSFAFVAVINPNSSGGLGNNTCSCPFISTSAYEVDWGAVSPPPNNTVPGSYLIYPTIGGTITRAGTGAIVINQTINPVLQGGGGGGGTGNIGSVVFSVSPLGTNNSQVQTATVKDMAGAPLSGVAITLLENAGTSGGYAHGTTNIEGIFQYTNHFPPHATYTDWARATLGTHIQDSNKITTVVP